LTKENVSRPAYTYFVFTIVGQKSVLNRKSKECCAVDNKPERVTAQSVKPCIGLILVTGTLFWTAITRTAAKKAPICGPF